jgi:hypothetical protein
MQLYSFLPRHVNHQQMATLGILLVKRLLSQFTDDTTYRDATPSWSPSPERIKHQRKDFFFSVSSCEIHLKADDD